ncbi:DUF1648 domain-containing protein [Dietzia sp. NPDC055343]
MTTTSSPLDDARDLPREPTAPWIRVLAIVAVAVWLAVVIWQFMVLPDRIPTHFDGSGRADGWSSKNGALAFSVLIPLLCVIPLPSLARLVLRWPQAINAPNRDWWITSGPRLRRFERLIREDLWLIAVLTLALLVAIDVGIAMTARAESDSMANGVLYGSLAVFGVGLFAVLARMYAGGRYAEQDVL